MKARENLPEGSPPGAVPLSAAIGALREELFRAWYDGQDKTVRFKPSPVELTLQVGVTWTGSAKAGVHWWLLELGGEVSRESAVTQTVKVTLEPRFFDEATGEPLEVLIDAVDASFGSTGEVDLDADG